MQLVKPPLQCWGTCVSTLPICWATGPSHDLPICRIRRPFILLGPRSWGSVSPCPRGPEDPWGLCLRARSPMSLGAVSRGPSPPMSLGAEVSGLQSPLGGSGPPPLGEAPGAVSRGPAAQTPAGHVDRIVAPSPVKRPHPGDPGTGWGDDDALRDAEMLRGPLQKDGDSPRKNETRPAP